MSNNNNESSLATLLAAAEIGRRNRELSDQTRQNDLLKIQRESVTPSLLALFKALEGRNSYEVHYDCRTRTFNMKFLFSRYNDHFQGAPVNDLAKLAVPEVKRNAKYLCSKHSLVLEINRISDTKSYDTYCNLTIQYNDSGERGNSYLNLL